MAVTPNYDFELPAFDSINWDVPIRANWTAVDTEIKTIDDREAADFAEVTAARVSLVYTDETPFASLTLRIDEIEDELKLARMGKTGSTDRLVTLFAVGHETSGANKPASFTALEFDTALIVNPVQIDASSFKVDGNLESTLKNGMGLKLTFATSGVQYARIKTATHAGGPDETTVVIWEDDPPLPGPIETINEVAYSFVKPGDAVDFDPGADIRDPTSASLDVYRYTSATFDLPFDESGGRVATTNTGRIARFDFASGHQVGLTYDAAGNAAKLDPTDGIEHKINGTLYERWKPTYSGELLTDLDRVFA